MIFGHKPNINYLPNIIWLNRISTIRLQPWYICIYTKRTKVFAHVQTMPHGRNMHATYVICTEENFKRFNISNHRVNLK